MNWLSYLARCAGRIRSIRSPFFDMWYGDVDYGRLVEQRFTGFFRSAHDAGRLKRRLAGDPAWLALDPHLRVEHRRRAAQAMALSDPPDGFYIREMRTCLDHTLTSWAAEELHEQGRQIGVRFLHPFFDPDLVEMLYRTPPRLLNAGGRSKGLVRRTMAKRFPGLGLDRQRKVVAGSFFRRSCFGKGQPWPIWPATSLRSRGSGLSMGQRWLPSSARR